MANNIKDICKTICDVVGHNWGKGTWTHQKCKACGEKKPYPFYAKMGMSN